MILIGVNLLESIFSLEYTKFKFIFKNYLKWRLDALSNDAYTVT